MAWRTDVDQNIRTRDDMLKDCTYVVISEEEEGMYYIFRFNSKDEILFGDYCFFSLEDAKFQCKEIYKIDENMWRECPDLDWSSIKSAPE